MNNKSNISNSSKKVTQKPVENIVSQSEKKNNSFDDIQLHQEKNFQRSSDSNSWKDEICISKNWRVFTDKNRVIWLDIQRYEWQRRNLQSIHSLKAVELNV